MKLLKVVSLVSMVFFAGSIVYSEAEYPKIVPSGYINTRYTADETAGAKDGFSLTNVRVGAKGDMTAKISFAFSVEGTNTDINNNKMLYDAYIDIRSIKYFGLRVGQYKYRLTLENVTSDTDLEMINKSLVVSSLVNPTRDIGIEFNRSFIVNAVKTDCYLDVLNGSGMNQSDENDYKTIVGRIVVSPVKGLSFGGSVYDGRISTSSVVKNRRGLELKYEYQKIMCKAEYLWGKDANVKKEGYYTTVGYSIIPEVMLLARYDIYDASINTPGAKNKRLTLGINYLIDKNLLLRNDYEVKMESPEIKNDLIVTQLQVKF
ncbi:MAG: porin [Elusimicrobia bacterium]|nr:porin [Elusimicrobiota bacterium]